MQTAFETFEKEILDFKATHTFDEYAQHLRDIVIAITKEKGSLDNFNKYITKYIDESPNFINWARANPIK